VRAHGPADISSQIASLALGKVKLAQKEYEEAATISKNACDTITTPCNQTHLQCRQVMGCVLGHLERYEEGISFYARALDGYTQMLGADHGTSQQCSEELDKLRALLAERTRTETVEQQREREKNHGADHPEESSDGRTGSEEGS
jgi:tetratricopeptide (TPR) repeat protein